ncbi:MAG: ATP-binding protein [Cyanobacteria bacterium J06641_2]
MTEPPQLPNVQIEISQEVGSGDATGMKVGEIKGSVTIYQTGSVASLSPDYATRIQNFFNEYSGTPKEPVPFGGREQEIELLDTWLDNDKAPPYLLLAAPAGRGKSALLVNWNKHLLAKQNIAVVFFPVSIRFRTNLASVVFAAIAAQLAALHGEKISGTLNTPVEDWRGIMSGYLNRPLSDGHRLLVIIDGLDEAVDWDAGADLFPSNPPKGLRIVVSARYLAGHKDAVSWLRILGWNKPGLAYTPNLLPLTKEGLADVLRKMGCPLDQLGARVDIVGELHRLSEGDPLLVRLYVDDLWKRGNEVIRLRPEDLQGIAPGLDGYFSNWWEYQCKLWGKEAPLKETGVRTFFYLLASSLGPLYQKDILNLVPKESKLTDSLILEF